MNSRTLHRLFILLLGFFCVNAVPAHAQWQRLETLAGFAARDLVTTTSGGIALLGAYDDGIRVSTDRGDSWRHRNDLDTLTIAWLDAHGNEIFLLATSSTNARGKRRVYRLPSIDAAPQPVPAPRDGSVSAFCVADNGWLYMTLEGNPATDSVYLSTDAGNSWTSVCRKYSDRSGKNALRVDPLRRLWSYDQWSLARWDPDTQQWIRVEQYTGTMITARWYFFRPNGDAVISTGTHIKVLPASGAEATTLFQSAFLSYPTIEFWMNRDGALLISDRIGDGSLYTQVFRSTTDDGQSWAVFDSSSNTYMQFLGELDGTVFAVRGTTLLRSDDLGRTFENRTTGLSAVTIQQFEIRGERIHAMTPGYALSDDAGATWQYREPESHSSVTPLQVLSDGTFLNIVNGSLRISHDSAATWMSPLPGLGVHQLVAADDVVVGHFSDSTIRRSTDDGLTWETSHRLGRSISNLFEAHGVFYAMHDDQLLRSTDRGVTWTTSTLPAIERAFLFGNTRALLLSASSILWRSLDHGDTWNPLPLDTLTRTLYATASNTRGDIAAVRVAGSPRPSSMDVVYSVNDGESWKKITYDLPAVFTADAFPFGVGLGFTASNTLFLSVRSRGFYTMDASTLGTNDTPPAEPTMMLDVWPTVAMNELHFAVRAAHPVRIHVTSLLGASIYEDAMAEGITVRRLDVPSWPPGTYFLHAVSAGRTVTRRFMILR